MYDSINNHNSNDNNDNNNANNENNDSNNNIMILADLRPRVCFCMLSGSAVMKKAPPPILNFMIVF